ncbi:hypothetical protein Nepgr_001320 [Nepenthes gracilis]|uniref:Uncharacterized protein n=1 Tax=Nepenthes gracilis TaxID=150966 RepID=A0AAD3RXD0_NEPGR|nr:hypothetical protein Nepgr_001320 [Nepenthes gracilis]
MAANVKFDLSSGSPDELGYVGNYPNGQRGNYPGANLDRSGSFRESSDGRNFSFGSSTSKGNPASMMDLPPFSHCLMLEPITVGDPKCSVELRRALGVSLTSVPEDNSFGAAHSKPPLTIATDELKRFKESVLEACSKARCRVKRLDESLNKLNKYCEALNPKKQQANERSTASSLLKTGTQSHRNSPDSVMQKLDDRSRNVALSKRFRTPVADMRAEARSNGIPRQHLILGKDKDVLKEGSLSCDLVEEKIRRLPAGREGWDKKMKKKRSVSNVFPGIDGDGEVKRAMHGRLSNDPGMQSSDVHGFRSGSSNGTSGFNKLDGTSSPASSSSRITPKNELEKVSLARVPTGMNKERILQKGNTKLNMREDNHLVSSSSKGRASRALRTGPAVVGNSSPSFPRISGVPEDWEQPMNKVPSSGGVHNRKRSMPTESSSPPMAQWVGQRPQKISRTRRTNIVSPTSNHDEVQVSSEGCTNADLTTRVSCGVNGSLPARNMANSAQHVKVKIENAPSPARLLESEETGVVENKLKERAVGASEVEEGTVNGYQHVGISGMITKKSKLVAKEEIVDGVRRQGRSGRGSSFSRGGMSPLGDKFDTSGATKPVRSMRPGTDKSGSKSGRPPLKKNSDRKGFIRLGLISNGSSPDFTGESDDDREELLAAAHFAHNASYHADTSLFWKKIEPFFSIRLEDKSYLMQQLKSAEEHQQSLNQMFGLTNNAKNCTSHEETCQPQSFASEERDKHLLSNGFMESGSMGELIDQFQGNDSSYSGRSCEEGHNSLTPLVQRVLSALIVEDEFDELEENIFGGNVSFLSGRDNPSIMAHRIFCNGDTTHSRCSSIRIPAHDEMWDGDYSLMHSEVGASPGPLQNHLNGSLTFHINASGNSPSECKYEQMSIEEKLLLELQSIGLNPETVPALAEGENEMINQDIAQLKKELHQQTAKKKAHLERLQKAVEEQEGSKGRDLEQVAMNRLIELAYRKLLATRGSYASRIGISKVPRHVALAFIKRTLARCRKFEDTSSSCFSEPALRDIILAAPTSSGNAESVECIGLTQSSRQAEAKVSGSHPTVAEQLDLRNDNSERGLFDAYESGSYQSDHAFAKDDPISNRGKKKELLLDDVGGTAALRSTSNLGNTLLAGAKGKRSERDRDKDLWRNSTPKAGRPSITNLRGEQKTKTKTKPKQKAAQLSTHAIYPLATDSSELAANGSSRKRDGLTSTGNVPDSTEESKESIDYRSLPLHELDSIEDLSMENGFGGHQDLSSWLNFDEDNLQDHDSMGLEIPMDDLSELNMLI